MESCQEAFEQLKQAMLRTSILHFYNYNLPTMVETDLSDRVVARVLLQQDPQTGQWHLIAYFLKTMQLAELNYNIHNKEIFAIILMLGKWPAELEGVQDIPFLIYSDHRSLEYFITTKKLSAR